MSAARPAPRRPAGLRGRVACITAVLLLAPVAAVGQPGLLPPALTGTALERALEAHSQQRQGLDFYVEILRGFAIPGLSDMPGVGRCVSNCLVHDVEELTEAQIWVDRIMTIVEVQVMLGLTLSPDTLRAAGEALGGVQSMLNPEMANAGVPALPDPWINPYTMLWGAGMMMMGAANAVEDAQGSLATSNQQAQQQASQTAQLIGSLQETGTEPTDSGPGTRYSAAVSMPLDPIEGQPVTATQASLLVLNDPPVILSHRIDGTIGAQNASRSFFIEVTNSDYRQVPGCNLYEPYRRTMRMGGMLDDAQMAEMQEAQAQLAEFEQQLAAMSPAERAMMEGMIGGQLDMVRNMANSGVMEHAQEIEEIICNPDLMALFSPVAPGFLLAEIQRDLVTLGYMPGNTDGVLDVLTEVAISQYQAERGLPVTGQPSADLALMLTSEVGG